MTLQSLLMIEFYTAS